MSALSQAPQSKKFRFLNCLTWIGSILFVLICVITALGYAMPVSSSASAAVPHSPEYEAKKANPQAIPYQSIAANPERYQGTAVKVTGRVLSRYVSADPDYPGWAALVTNSAPGYTASRAQVVCLVCGIASPDIGDQVHLVAFVTGEASESGYRVEPWRIAPVLLVAD